MAINYDRQMRKIQDLEAQTDDPMSLRLASDLADSINNYKARIGNFKIISQCHFDPSTEGAKSAGSTTEHLVYPPFAPRYVPDGYDNFLWFFRHFRASGSGTTTWRLFALPHLYFYGTNNNVDLSAFPSGTYRFATITTSSTTPAIDYAVISNVKFRMQGQFVCFILTADDSDASTVSHFTNIDVYPMLEDCIL